MEPQNQPQQPIVQPTTNPAQPPLPQLGTMPIVSPGQAALQPQVTPLFPQQPVSIPPAFSSPQPTRSGKKLVLLGIVVLVILAAVSGGVVLASHHSTPTTSTSISTPTNNTTATSNNSTSGSKPSTTDISSEQKTALNQSATTPLGYTIKATQLVTNFPVTDASQVSSGYEPVLVDISVTSNGSYAGATPGGTDFALEASGASYPEGTASNKNGDYVADSDVTAAGFSSYDDATSDSSGGQTGYLLFILPKSASSFTLVYNEPQGNVLGSNSTIPAKSIDIPL
jgi:hypothetical protein